MPSAARLLLYSYVQRNVACALYELRIAPFEYCSLHVSTVISYVSTVPLSSSSHNGLCQCSGTISMNLNIFL
ncbi:hypothetical protein T09_13199 [Trichinella sp. T9]|nr:hypothetical protein T09_13199 [Trichinella sp. T9]